ncbi:MAG: RHS repeat-associated core domain-containing protein [Verrucomicrobiota bacterium]
MPHSYTPPTRVMTYDDDNRLLTVNSQNVYSDTDGNLTSAPLTNGTFATYAYDARNRLLNVGSVTNVYDVMNNRIGQIYGTNSVIYVVNPNAKLPQMLMRIKNGVTKYYVYGAGLLYEVTETAAATNTLTYHYDYRGSTVALMDGNGNVTDRIEYSAYATLTYRTGTNDTPFLFNGRYGVQTDPNGLLYMRARYYNPYLCRFLNPDPLGFSGGLNFYAYANGNPVSYLDPFGLGAVGENPSPSWIQGAYNYLYTGQRNSAPGVYGAAVEAAGDYVYNSGGVRGFYGGVGVSGKQPGYGSIAGQAGLTGTWTVDSGFGSEIDVGAGLQERGQNSLGVFTSQTIGVGGSYRFYNQSGGFQLPSSSNVQFPAVYGGTANSAGGANFVIPQNANPVALGINYGAGYGGILIDPSKVWQNFADSYRIITGTSTSVP